MSEFDWYDETYVKIVDQVPYPASNLYVCNTQEEMDELDEAMGELWTHTCPFCGDLDTVDADAEEEVEITYKNGTKKMMLAVKVVCQECHMPFLAQDVLPSDETL